MRNVGVDGHFVCREVMIDEEPVPLVDGKLLHQGCTSTHGHRSDHLAARSPRIETSAGGADSKHASDAGLSRRSMNAHFYEMSAESGLLVLLVEVAIFHRIPRNDAPVA